MHKFLPTLGNPHTQCRWFIVYVKLPWFQLLWSPTPHPPTIPWACYIIQRTNLSTVSKRSMLHDLCFSCSYLLLTQKWTEMKAVSFLLLSVAWSLGEVQSQVFPYISFMGQTLANNSYVDLKFVGNDSNGFNNLQCRTDLATCCSRNQGSHRGDWYYPNGSRLQFQGGFFEERIKTRLCYWKRKMVLKCPLAYTDVTFHLPPSTMILLESR